MAVLQAATILAPVVSEKHIFPLKYQQKLPIDNQQIKKQLPFLTHPFHV